MVGFDAATVTMIFLTKRPITQTATVLFSTAAAAVAPVLLQQCKSLFQAKLIHQQLLIQGLTTNLSTNLIASYIAFNSRTHAVSLLESLLPSRAAVFSWNVVIRHFLVHGLLPDVLVLLRNMKRLCFSPDHYTFPFVLKACGDIPSFSGGASVHGLVLVSGFEWNVFVCNALVGMYSRSGGLEEARQMFDEMCERRAFDVISWNSIISAYMLSGEANRALEMFKRMRFEFGVCPDTVSLVNVLPACAAVGACLSGKQVHGFAIRNAFSEDVFVGNAIVTMYAKCGRMGEADKVFERMTVKDVVSWNVMVTGYSQIGELEKALSLVEKMKEDNLELDVVTWSAVIAGYAQRGQGNEAVDVFRKMQFCGSKANVITLISILSACASSGALLSGKEIHSYTIKCMLNIDENNVREDLMVINSLIDMYAKCKRPHVAHTIFDSTAKKDRDVVTWTVMIGGYAQSGEANDALELLSEMLKEWKSLKPNAFTISCALMACAHLAAERFGKQIHAHVLRNQYESGLVFLENCLIDMYSKSGHISAARVVFDKMQLKNSVSWTSLLTAYGMHGRGEDVVKVFNEMQRAGLAPDGITFLVLLYACSHSRMVDQGITYFNSMQKEFGVIPELEHYACMVDLLGRAGRLDEAVKLIERMPMEPTPILWIALLSGCRIHGNVELGEYASSCLLELESENDGSYTLLSNIYANARRWKDVARIRSLMKNSGIKKRPGCSWIQGRKGTVTFYVGDRTHPQSEDIYDLLGDLILRIKAMGYVPETSFALHDVDDEEKDDLLFEHSEKLALAYGILTSSPGVPIRITKNLRVCGDCHSAFTYISMIIDHEIVLRDSSRFHHFKSGTCSCRGYW